MPWRSSASPRIPHFSSRLSSKNPPHAQWALSLLRRTEPETWDILVAADFATAAAEERRTIFSTLAAGHPPAAAAMIPNFNKAERRDLIVEISDFHSKHAPGDFANNIPVLMELVRDQKQDIYRRGGAMETLSAADLSESQQEELTGLLVAEIRAPQKGEYFSGTLGYALEALASLPHPERHLDLVLALPHVPKDAFGKGFAAVDSMTRDNPAREKILAEFLKPSSPPAPG